jgi:hypothetical protein
MAMPMMPQLIAPHMARVRGALRVKEKQEAKKQR